MLLVDIIDPCRSAVYVDRIHGISSIGQRNIRVMLNSPGKGEVLVRIAASGVCHSDYHVMNGATKHPLPAVLGHEGAGVVEAVGADVARVKVGDHVVLNWAPACGHCFYCLRNKP